MNGIFDFAEISICNLINTAEKGNMPVYQLSAQYNTFCDERAISYSRQYMAQGVNSQIDYVLRIQDLGYRPKINQYAVLTNYRFQENENGDQFRITNVQPVFDENELRCFDLSLMRLNELYDYTN